MNSLLLLIRLRIFQALRALRDSQAKTESESDEAFGPPFTAEEDFEPGDVLIFLGNSLYCWVPTGSIPPAFRAKRAIRQGEQVWNDPLREGSDIEVIVPDELIARGGEWPYS